MNTYTRRVKGLETQECFSMRKPFRSMLFNCPTWGMLITCNKNHKSLMSVVSTTGCFFRMDSKCGSLRWRCGINTCLVACLDGVTFAAGIWSASVPTYTATAPVTTLPASLFCLSLGDALSCAEASSCAVLHVTWFCLPVGRATSILSRFSMLFTR